MTTVAEVRPVVERLREQGIMCDFEPPLDAPIPRYNTKVVFGDCDEGVFPYVLERTGDGGWSIDDRAGDPYAMGSGDPVALCIEVLACDQYLWDGETLEGRCSWCNRNVDNFDDGHRVTAVLRGGKGVECVARGDITAADAGPLKRMGMPK